MKLKEILVPYDNSEFSKKALEYAADLAEMAFLTSKNKQIVKITLLHIIQDIPMTKSYFGGSVRQPTGEVLPFSEHTMTVYDEIIRNMRKIIEEQKEKYKSKEGIHIEPLILSGNPSSQIIEYADKNNVDVVVIGSKGQKGISKVIKGLGLGSVSRNVSEKVSCPIVIIR